MFIELLLQMDTWFWNIKENIDVMFCMKFSKLINKADDSIEEDRETYFI